METESNAAEAKILPATGRRSSPADARDGGHPERPPSLGARHFPKLSSVEYRL